MVQFKVPQPDGSVLEVSPDRVASDLSDMGIPAKLAPSGMDIEYELDGQMMTMPVTDILNQRVGKVSGMSFAGDSGEYIDRQMRMGIENLPNDSVRKKYLEFALTNQGLKDPQVFGMGSDWGFIEPGSGKLRALTNIPGMEMSDLGAVPGELARFAGSTVGGGIGLATGAPTGPGAVATTMAGAGAGSLAGQALMQTAMTAVDPAYTQALASEGGMAGVMKDVGTKSLVDATGAGLVSGAGRLLSKFAPTVSKAFGKAPISRTAERVASGAEEGLGAVASAAQKINTPLGRGIVSELGPGLGTAQLAGMAAQAPAAAVRSAPKAMNWVRRRLDMPEVPLGPETVPADRFGEAAARAFRRGMGSDEIPQKEKIARSAADVLGEQFERFGKSIADRRVRRAAEEQGASATQEMLDQAVREATASRYKQAGVGIGRTLEGIGAAGRAVDQGIDLGADYALRGISGVSRLGSRAAGVGRLGAQMAAPFESGLYRYAPSRIAEENYLNQ